LGKSRVISFCTGGFKSGLFEKATGEEQVFKDSEWMSAEDVAAFMKQILELPKNMEISEVVINRKTLKQ
jgi:NADP-dependent 3-hydroxy acid dehydrogenase YdfG